MIHFQISQVDRDDRTGVSISVYKLEGKKKKNIANEVQGLAHSIDKKSGEKHLASELFSSFPVFTLQHLLIFYLLFFKRIDFLI
jgi:hypothetical protein